MIVALIGFMGCGKSTVGRVLARQINWDFIDLDHKIEKAAKRSIPEIFEQEGEFGFRKRETECLIRCLQISEELNRTQNRSLVLSLGGGTPLLNGSTIREKCTCIYLEASYESIITHIGGKNNPKRPLFSKETLKQRLAEREPIYRQTAHHIVSVDGKSIEDIVQEITSVLPLKWSLRVP